MLNILTLCFGLVATLPHLLTGMEQPSVKYSPNVRNAFIDPNRGAQARTLEKIAILTIGYSGFVLDMLKSKQAFASSETSLENKLNFAVEGFIAAQNTKDFSEFLDLCTIHHLPLQAGALERGRKFIDQGIVAECERACSQFQQSLSVVSKYQQMVYKIDATLGKNSSATPIEKPAQLFAMLYGNTVKEIRTSNDKNPVSEKPTDTENPFIMDPKNPTS